VTTWLTRRARSLTGPAGFYLSGVSVTIVLLVAIVAYRQARAALREQVLERLGTVADSREQQLNRWVDQQRVEVRFLAGFPASATSFPSFWVSAARRPEMQPARP
jgi:hypothetical protein